MRPVMPRKKGKELPNGSTATDPELGAAAETQAESASGASGSDSAAQSRVSFWMMSMMTRPDDEVKGVQKHENMLLAARLTGLTRSVLRRFSSLVSQRRRICWRLISTRGRS